ncbi:MAG: HAD family hydrolase [Epsilonproteobacteria bacterium]|nr:HAD family hydrolase [Campylobacterota bacterium]
MTTILFDLDGTLIDSTEAILESFEQSFEHFGLDTPSDELIKSFIGYPLDIMYEKLGVHSRNTDEIIDKYKKHYRKISREKTTLLPFAREALDEAEKFATLGIVTTKTKRYSLELLEHMDILRYFKVIIGREDVQNPKPHPEPVLKAVSILNAKKQNSWMIGDTVMDLQSAKNAGINYMGVTCGYGKKEELKNMTQNVHKNSLEAIVAISKCQL